MRTMIIILAWALGIVPAWARLGETNVQIRQRYGPVQSRDELGTNAWQGHYLFKEYRVMVRFRDNVSECEVIQPLESRKFSDAERDSLLAAIGGNGDWKKDTGEVDVMKEFWVNRSTQAQALVSDELLGASTLIVSSKEYAATLNKQYKEGEKKKAEGF